MTKPRSRYVPQPEPVQWGGAVVIAFVVAVVFVAFMVAVVAVAAFVVFRSVPPGQPPRTVAPPRPAPVVRPAPAPPPVIPTPPAAPTPPDNWGTVVDPLGDCRVTRDGDRLTIAVPGGESHNLNPLPGWDNLNAPRVLREVAGDFEATVVVLPYDAPQPRSSSHGGSSYVGAGLVVWQDDGQCLRLFRAAMGEFNGGAPYVHPEWFVRNGGHGQSQHPVAQGPLHLRVTRSGDTLRLAHSPDGRAWSELQTVTDLPLGQRISVGVAAVSSINREFRVQFEKFAVVRSGTY